MASPKTTIQRFLTLLEAQPEVGAAARLLLAPLVDYDRRHDGDLVQTLRIYFMCNGNTSRASESLFLHRNGLIYRLGRIENLLGVSLSDPEVRLALEMGLRMLRKEDAP